ncbi:anillin-like [Actinia tenebrosa]|uniref:Anillin-like n=1 Tax=Actinia tenebrosa TaxID=6105 RepID=A0A6P8IZ70_ACTTE|nr:anillin-like [Actinia tenebrosa]
MDPFTQKLLERTQTRKEQLAKKKEELAACRNKRNAPAAPSPVKPRRPLSEDNTDDKDKLIDDNQKRRINSDGSVPKTPKEPTTPKAPITPKRATMPKAQSVLQGPSTPSSVTKVRGGVEIDTSSPSIQARREMLILMQQKDQENKTTPKKHWKKALDMNSNENSSPTVAARSAIFAQDKDSQPIFPKPSVSTPGKISAERNVFEKNPVSVEVKAVKTDAAAPPKPPRTIDVEKTLTREKSSSKRKAPAPPTSSSGGQKSDSEAGDTPVPKPRSESKVVGNDNYDQTIVSVKCADEKKPAKRERLGEGDTHSTERTNAKDEPTPKPRKRRSAESTTGGSENSSTGERNKNLEDERTKRREERKKARMESRERGGIMSVTAQAVEILEGKNEAIPVEVNSVCTPRSDQKSRAKVTVVRSESSETTAAVKQKDASSTSKAIPETIAKPEEICDAILEAVVYDEPKKPISKSTVKPKEGVSEFKPSRAAPTRPPPPQGISRFASQTSINSGLDELNETVNLNDVNIHEMTFTFDFSTFDKIQEDRETKFQKSFDEQQRELVKEKRETSCSQSSDDSGIVSPYIYEPKTKLEVEQANMGVYKSGYNSESGDPYATKMYKKAKPPVPERPKPVQDVIKELLDEAASQQNIILQTSQALNVCDSSNDIFKGSQEEVEAERVLLLASERKQACLNEHHRIKNKKNESKKDCNKDASNACTSTISIAGIRLSLKQEFMDVLRVGIRHDLGVFHFVCHVQNGPLEITSTKSLSINDCNEGNYLMFPDKFVLENVNPDFAVVVRVFGMHVQKYVPSASSAVQKGKFFPSPKAAKTKRHGIDRASPGATPMPVFRNSNFKLIGSTRVTLSQIGSKKWMLDGVAEGCPLKDYIQMKVHCTPQYTSHVKGFLTVLEDVGGFSAWQRRWCVLEGGLLSYWRYPGDETTQAPVDTLDIGQCTSDHITTVPRDLCARPNTIEVCLKKNNDQVKFLLACDTKEDRITWVNCLNDAMCDMKAWTKSNKGPLYPELGHVSDTKEQHGK